MFSKQTAMDEFNCFTATSWNMNCKFRAGKPYLLSLLESSTVMVLNEHALYPKELYKLKHLHSSFNAFVIASLPRSRLEWLNSLSNIPIILCLSMS